VSWSNDIVVYDSFSTDHTRAIASDFGARLIDRPGQDSSSAFGGDEAFHRTWGVREIKYKNSWLFVIDADERLTPEASAELQAIASGPDPCCVAYRMRRRDFFQGRHLKFVQASPWFIRFFRPEFVRYERLVNPVTIIEGSIGDLKSYIDHYPFSKGISHWIDRHNTYSTLEAKQILNVREANFRPSIRKALLSQNLGEKRLHLKNIYYYAPARPLVKFLIIYFFRFGFLDGQPGLRYALLVAIYEYLIDLKLNDLKAKPLSPL
jgi:glycosyltransferase involved in cell wall biosynthesis